MIISVPTQVCSYIVVDDLNLLKNPCTITIAHHISLSENTVCSLTIARWGGNEGRKTGIYKGEKTCGQEFTDVRS